MGLKASKKVLTPVYNSSNLQNLKIETIDKQKLKKFKIVGGQNLPIEEGQLNILNPYFDIRYGFIDKFIDKYVLAYNLDSVIKYLDSLSSNLYKLNIDNPLWSINGIQFRYEVGKRPYNRFRKNITQNRWKNELNLIIKNKYVPMQIKTIHNISSSLDIPFLVNKQNYVLIV